MFGMLYIGPACPAMKVEAGKDFINLQTKAARVADEKTKVFPEKTQVFCEKT